MGADIHFFVERYSTDNYEGPKDLQENREEKLGVVLADDKFEPRWITADKWIYDNKYDEGFEWSIDYNTRFYNGRNYYLFGVLAGVRGDDNIISEARGVPDDASYAYKHEVERWDGDGHSHSYYTLDELLAVDWGKINTGEYDGWLDEWLETIEKMKTIDPDSNKVRCVFFFDN